MLDFLNDIIKSYASSPLSYSLGLVVLGLVTHRLLCWLFPIQRAVSDVDPENDLLNDMVIPSRCIRWRVINLRGRWHTSIHSITNTPTLPDWRPILVFANRKSGSNQGAEILEQCRKLLNPIQVHDLSSKPPNATLEICQLLPNIPIVILVCGGDGSVNWVLSTIKDMELETEPVVSVLPLGTGNDLSNMLGWGTLFDETDTVENRLIQLRNAEPINIDRWKITIDYRKAYFCSSWKKQRKTLSMTNYFSIGCDALIALNFHKQRQKKPTLFSKRSLNKLFYFGYGAMDVLEQHCKDLNKWIDLWLDGKKIDLPNLEGILFLNISSWGGGCQIWNNMSGDLQWDHSDPGDGKFEVMGFTSSFHMAQIQIKLAEPVRLGQAKCAEVEIKTKVPAQVDGEPWEQGPCHLKVGFDSQATLLMKNASESSDDGSEILQLETN